MLGARSVSHFRSFFSLHILWHLHIQNEIFGGRTHLDRGSSFSVAYTPYAQSEAQLNMSNFVHEVKCGVEFPTCGVMSMLTEFQTLECFSDF